MLGAMLDEWVDNMEDLLLMMVDWARGLVGGMFRKLRYLQGGAVLTPRWEEQTSLSQARATVLGRRRGLQKNILVENPLS